MPFNGHTAIIFIVIREKEIYLQTKVIFITVYCIVHVAVITLILISARSTINDQQSAYTRI